MLIRQPTAGIISVHYVGVSFLYSNIKQHVAGGEHKTNDRSATTYAAISTFFLGIFCFARENVSCRFVNWHVFVICISGADSIVHGAHVPHFYKWLDRGRHRE